METLALYTEASPGVTRPAWSDALMDAYRWVARRAAELGLESAVDPAGNLRMHWGPGERRIAVGSHLDTVPNGGRYDGALGVLGGLEAIRLLGDSPPAPISVLAFMDEEGTRFGTTLFGSRAFVGEDLSDLAERMDAAGVTLSEAMASQGHGFDAVPQARGVDVVDAYLELHIEQGPVLEHHGVDVGVVTSIVGLLGFAVRLEGQANHAGTTPMELRRDALAGAARVLCELRDYARARPGVTSNVGTVAVEPGGKNVVPGACEFTIDIRAATGETFAELESTVRAVIERVADDEQLTFAIDELYRLAPVAMDTGLIDLIEQAAAAAGASTQRMPSGAGHDAMELGRRVPTGMLFVPSSRGVSHSPHEYTTVAHCSLGARVLARALQLVAAAP